MGIREEVYEDGWDPAATLAKDEAGADLRAILDVLSQNRAQLKAALDRGVPPDEFKKGQALLASYTAAKDGLEKAWKSKRS